MLIDDAIDYLRHSKLGRLYNKAAISQLTESAKYVLSPEIVQTVTRYEHEKPQNLLKGFPFARPPHRLTWIEFPVTPRVDALRDLDTAIDPHQPARIGYLIEALNPKHTQYLVQYIWDTPKAFIGHEGYDPITIPIAAAEYNIEPIESPIDQVEFARFSQLVKESSGIFKKYRNQTDQHEFIYRLFDRHHIIPCQWIPPSLQQDAVQQLEENVDHVTRELTSELLFLPCALLLLNAKNAIALAPSDIDRLNRQREKSGKSKLAEYQTVKLHLSRRNSTNLQNANSQGSTKRLHICSGHFKFRKTADGDVKPFWWTEHQRGQPTGFASKKTKIIVP